MDKVISITIDSLMDGQRIDYVLEKQLKISDNLIKQLKKDKNGILLNGVPEFVVKKVSKGDTLVVNIKGKVAQNIVPVNIPLDILFEDEDILVINKPGNMPVHPSRKHLTDTVANAVMHYLGSNETVHIITRLDRETSGVVLIAKNQWSAAMLSEQMKNGKIKKEYMAVVNGIMPDTKDTISAPIKRKEEGNVLRCVADDGKEAVSIYEVLNTMDDFSLVKLIPVTGRTHQLRVHLSFVGHPIFGDKMYGAKQKGERTRLHCSCLKFFHPESNEKIIIEAPVPDDFNV